MYSNHGIPNEIAFRLLWSEGLKRRFRPVHGDSTVVVKLTYSTGRGVGPHSRLFGREGKTWLGSSSKSWRRWRTDALKPVAAADRDRGEVAESGAVVDAVGFWWSESVPATVVRMSKRDFSRRPMLSSMCTSRPHISYWIFTSQRPRSSKTGRRRHLRPIGSQYRPLRPSSQANDLVPLQPTDGDTISRYQPLGISLRATLKVRTPASRLARCL